MKVELKGCQWRTLGWTYVEHSCRVLFLDLPFFGCQREYQVGSDHSPTLQGSPHVRRKSVLPGKLACSTRLEDALMAML